MPHTNESPVTPASAAGLNIKTLPANYTSATDYRTGCCRLAALLNAAGVA